MGVAVSGEGFTSSGVGVWVGVFVGTVVKVKVGVEVDVGGMVGESVDVVVGLRGVFVTSARAVAEAIASAVAVMLPISSSV